MREKIKLLPCPNPECGRRCAKEFSSIIKDAPPQVQCVCGCSGEICDTPEEAIASWNSLPRHEDYAEVVKALKQGLDALEITHCPTAYQGQVIYNIRASLAKVRK